MSPQASRIWSSGMRGMLTGSAPELNRLAFDLHGSNSPW
jgi:hypothetical protein